MRAIFFKFENDLKEDKVTITGDPAHHLMVTRVKVGEKILLLNGSGLKVFGIVSIVSKNNVEVKVQANEEFKPEHSLSLAIALPKKDAFEDILKNAVELGIREIYPLISDFSQYEYNPSERIERILESALVQSNNPYFPIIHAQNTLIDFLSTHNDELVFFNSIKSDSKTRNKMKNKKTILIGPEGGFSPDEVVKILNYPQIHEIHLPTPILRAPTAVGASVGYLLAMINK